jgi:PAS domain S-box-containing protein
MFADDRKILQETILNNTEEALIATNLKGEIVFWSDGASTIFGYDQEEMLGKKLSEICPIINNKKYGEFIKRIKNNEAGLKELVEECEGVRNDKSSLRLFVTVVPLKSDAGQVVGLVSSFKDMTLIKNLEEALAFYAQASRILSSSLDYRMTLDSVARLAVPKIADWCIVNLLDEQGEVINLAMAHRDPKKVRWAEKMRKALPLQITDTYGIANVLRTGLSEYYPNVDDNIISKLVKDTKRADMIKKVGLCSVIIVPLKLQGKVVGGITFATAESGRHYSELEFKMAEQLGVLASLAMDNSTLYESVLKEQERLTYLLENVPVIIWEACEGPTCPDQKITFINKYVEKFLGYPLEDWYNEPNFWLKIVHPEDRDKAKEDAYAIYAGCESGTHRFRWVKKDGDPVWVEAHLYVIKDEKGRPVGLRGATMDISQTVEIETRKDVFIGIASHELKTPLTSLKAFTQISRQSLKNKNGKDVNRYLSRMDEQITKLDLLINELLDVSKIQEGRLDLHKSRFSLSKLVKETVEDIKHLIEPRPVIIVGNLGTSVTADRYRLGQVLSNLILNAAKYSENDREIQITIENKKREVVVSVKDYGMGIDKRHQEKIFERFYRVGERQDNRMPGLGMGLHISFSIVTKHGGKMWVESERGKGSTFYFALPKGKRELI